MLNFLQCGQVVKLEVVLVCEETPQIHHADGSAGLRKIGNFCQKGIVFRSSALVHIVSEFVEDRSFDHRV